MMGVTRSTLPLGALLDALFVGALAAAVFRLGLQGTFYPDDPRIFAVHFDQYLRTGDVWAHHHLAYFLFWIPVHAVVGNMFTALEWTSILSTGIALGGLALGVCFVALAAVRVVDTGSNVPWSAGTLMGWAADSSAYQRLTGLWRYLALPYALFALVAMPFLACAVRGGHLRWSARGWGMRALLLIALWVPLVATVAYLGIFELGGYFVGLPVLLLTCLGAPALRVCARIEARVARRCPQLGGALPSARGSGGTGSARLPRGSTRMVGPGHCAGP